MAKAREGGCVDCGSTEYLNFHHLDPATKVIEVSSMNTSSDEKFWAEVAKCVCVCIVCHARRHV